MEHECTLVSDFPRRSYDKGFDRSLSGLPTHLHRVFGDKFRITDSLPHSRKEDEWTGGGVGLVDPKVDRRHDPEMDSKVIFFVKETII